MINRYLSFVSPSTCILVNNFFNQMDSFPFESIEERYAKVNAVFPNVGKRYIKYKRKAATEKKIEKNISEDDIKYLADLLEISRREVSDYIVFADTINKEQN